MSTYTPTWNFIKFISCTQFLNSKQTNSGGLNEWSMPDCICDLILSLTAVVMLFPLVLLVRR